MDESIGERIRRLREAQGLNQKDLEDDGVNVSYISRIESGDRRPSETALRKIAFNLGVTAHFLESGSQHGTCPHCGKEVK